MSSATQSAFAAGLLSAPSLPVGLTAWNGASTERRYAVYRNNVITGLTRALASRFPATESIVGADFFHAMADTFVRHSPPRSPLLSAYGDDFPDFVADFDPARTLAYLPDVMRLEVARGHAYHAANAAPLDPQSFATVEPDALGSLIFTPHPSLSILSSIHPVVTIWAMNAGLRPLSSIDDWQGEDALVLRPHMIVEVTPLAPGGAVFFRRLAAGVPLAGAADAAQQADMRFDLSANLTVLLLSGAFTAFNQENTDESRRHA